jgi:hypothetical protein
VTHRSTAFSWCGNHEGNGIENETLPSRRVFRHSEKNRGAPLQYNSVGIDTIRKYGAYGYMFQVSDKLVGIFVQRRSP